jgi:uncharacterized membrane protein
MNDPTSGTERTVAAPPLDSPMGIGEDSGVATVPSDPERLWTQGTRVGAENGFGLARSGKEPVPSIAAIMGHPLHPSVVPLPIGAFVGAFVSDIAYSRTGDPFWARAGRHLMQAGVATGLLAGALGAIDFLGRDRIRSHGSAWLHAGGNLAAVGLGAVSLGMRASRERGSVLPAGLALSATIVSILGVTGWLGGELSYRHRIGVTES